MTLSDNGKDWIASNLGSGNCISHSSQSFTYHDNNSNTDISDSGSSAKMLNRLVDDLVDYITFGGKIYYSSFTGSNGGGASDDDIRWVNNNDWCVGDGGSGGPGDECEGGTKECTDATHYRECDSEGNWTSRRRCPSGYHCEGKGICVENSSSGTCSTTANFSYSVNGKTISFTDTSTSTGSGCSISSRLWNLGSGMASQNRTCSRTFPNYNANYPIILRVTDSAGNSKTVSKTVRTGSSGGSGTVCTPGVRECTDGTHYRTCSSNGTWGRTIRCATGNHCEGNGQCVKDSTGGGPGGATGDTAGPYEVDIGSGQSCSPGDPPFTMDVSGGYAYHTRLSNVSFIGLGGIEITNTDGKCTARFAWVTKVWRGSGYSSCPTATPTAEDASRYYEEGGQTNPPINLATISPGETKAVFGNCEIPMTMTGTVTICADLWGNFSKSALLQELEDAGFSD